MMVPLFLSTLSLRRATGLSYFYIIKITISIHALLAESDVYKRCEFDRDNGFLSTLSLRRATRLLLQLMMVPLFLSTLSLRRATIRKRQVIPIIQISIHALLAESDLRVMDGSKSSIEISIHALLAESDPPRHFHYRKRQSFLSTLSLRRATRALRQLQSALRYFYPRSPCGERPKMDPDQVPG